MTLADLASRDNRTARTHGHERRATGKLISDIPEPSHFGKDGTANLDAFESMSSDNGGGSVFGMQGVLSEIACTSFNPANVQWNA